jgi:hypothetical protein
MTSCVLCLASISSFLIYGPKNVEWKVLQSRDTKISPVSKHFPLHVDLKQSQSMRDMTLTRRWRFKSLLPKDGSSIVLWNIGILPRHYTASQFLKMATARPSEELICYYITTQRRSIEDGGRMVLRNFGVLPHNTSSQVWRWRQRGAPKRRYPIATLHGVTTLKTRLVFCDQSRSVQSCSGLWMKSTLRSNRRCTPLCRKGTK